jgi:N-acetylneuraminic acid mutarotase
VEGIATVFGGGNATEASAVQRFVPGGVATIAGHLPIARSDLGAVTVGARTYLVGGYDGNSIRATALSTVDGVTFALLGDLPVPVRYPAVAATGTDVVILGGTTASGPTADVQVLDTRTGVARVAGRLPATLSDASATTVRGQIYVFGGIWGGRPSSQVWRWDPTTTTLEPVGNLPAPTTDGAATTIGDTAYFVGGESPRPTSTVSVLTVR